MHRIIIDGDPGHDDILAFLVALAHPEEIEILAYTTVVGNARVEDCSANALKVMDYFGVDIPGVFVFYNAALEKGIIPSETSTRSETRRFLSEYDSTIPDAAQAHRCITCYHCAGKCPQNIFIARQMERITELTESLRDRLCTDD